MQLTTEMMNELRLLIRDELRRRERQHAADKTVFNRVCQRYEAEMKAFDYETYSSFYNVNGKLCEFRDEIRMSCKIRDALSALLRGVYQVRNVYDFTAANEAAITAFVGGVLQLMRDLKDGAGKEKQGEG